MQIQHNTKLTFTNLTDHSSLSQIRSMLNSLKSLKKNVHKNCAGPVAFVSEVLELRKPAQSIARAIHEESEDDVTRCCPPGGG